MKNLNILISKLRSRIKELEKQELIASFPDRFDKINRLKIKLESIKLAKRLVKATNPKLSLKYLEY